MKKVLKVIGILIFLVFWSFLTLYVVSRITAREMSHDSVYSPDGNYGVFAEHTNGKVTDLYVGKNKGDGTYQEDLLSISIPYIHRKTKGVLYPEFEISERVKWSDDSSAISINHQGIKVDISIPKSMQNNNAADRSKFKDRSHKQLYGADIIIYATNYTEDELIVGRFDRVLWVAPGYKCDLNKGDRVKLSSHPIEPKTEYGDGRIMMFVDDISFGPVRTTSVYKGRIPSFDYMKLEDFEKSLMRQWQLKNKSEKSDSKKVKPINN
ncbi:MAG: hypothetical protein ACYTFY_14730 [Planctomycetota bacterium]